VTVLRLLDQDRPAVAFSLDGAAAQARAGDTVLTALLTAGETVRRSEFGDGPRAGFCWMGACQDCWLAIDGVAARACTTLVAPGMAVVRR